jgi:hypothetical protein
VLGVVENMAGLRQRADAFRFTLPGGSGAAGSGEQQARGGKQQAGGGGSGSGSAAAEERDVTEQVLAALRQVDPSLEVGIQFVKSNSARNRTFSLVICLAVEPGVPTHSMGWATLIPNSIVCAATLHVMC